MGPEKQTDGAAFENEVQKLFDVEVEPEEEDKNKDTEEEEGKEGKGDR